MTVPMHMKLVGPLIMMVAMTSTVAAAPRGVALVLARLVDVEDVTEEPAGSVYIDGTYRLTFKLKGRLIGEVSGYNFTQEIKSARPFPGHDYYLLLDRRWQRDRVVWSGVARHGVCIDPDTAAEYGIEDSLIRLQKNRPCQ